MWPNSQESASLVTFTQEILNGKLDFCASKIENLFFETCIIRRIYLLEKIQILSFICLQKLQFSQPRGKITAKLAFLRSHKSQKIFFLKYKNGVIWSESSNRNVEFNLHFKVLEETSFQTMLLVKFPNLYLMTSWSLELLLLSTLNLFWEGSRKLCPLLCFWLMTSTLIRDVTNWIFYVNALRKWESSGG